MFFFSSKKLFLHLFDEPLERAKLYVEINGNTALKENDVKQF